MLDTYTEYEAHETVEARLTKDLDLYDMVHQAFEYEKKCVAENIEDQMDLEEFFHEGRILSKFNNPQIKLWITELMSQRREFWQLNANHPHAEKTLKNSANGFASLDGDL